jgi:hypothetical protein
MHDKYQPSAIEQAARAHWAQPLWSGHEAYRVVEDASKPKYYACAGGLTVKNIRSTKLAKNSASAASASGKLKRKP